MDSRASSYEVAFVHCDIRLHYGPSKYKLPPHLIHQCLELVNILKTAVHAGKTHIGHFVDFFQFAHYQFADAGGGHFAQAQVEQFFFDPFDGRTHLLGADRALA